MPRISHLIHELLREPAPLWFEAIDGRERRKDELLELRHTINQQILKLDESRQVIETVRSKGLPVDYLDDEWLNLNTEMELNILTYHEKLEELKREYEPTYLPGSITEATYSLPEADEVRPYGGNRRSGRYWGFRESTGRYRDL